MSQPKLNQTRPYSLVLFYNDCEAERQEEIEKVQRVQAEDSHHQQCPVDPSSSWASRWLG